MLELDVRLTRDGVPVVLHDPTLDRIWGVSRALSEMTWDDVRAIAHGDYRIPTLSEVLDHVSHPFMVDFVDLAVVDALAEVLEARRPLDRFLVVTGNIPALRRLRNRVPDVVTGLTWNFPVLPDDDILDDTKVSYFNPDYRLLRPEWVKYMHSRGLRVSCWTVDHLDDMERILDYGVDAMVTNRTDRLTACVRRRSEAPH